MALELGFAIGARLPDALFMRGVAMTRFLDTGGAASIWLGLADGLAASYSLLADRCCAIRPAGSATHEGTICRSRWDYRIRLCHDTVPRSRLDMASLTADAAEFRAVSADCRRSLGVRISTRQADGIVLAGGRFAGLDE